MNYKQKYLKYKNKYFQLKKKGGAIDIVDLDKEYISEELKKNQENLGQNNCGIIFIDNYVVKCIKITDRIIDESEDDIKYLEKAEKINNELEGFFPKFYKWNDGKLFNYIDLSTTEEKKYAKCKIIERLDGDLTDYIIKNSYLRAFGNLDDFDFYYERLPKTMIRFIDKLSDSIENQEKFNNILNSVKKFLFEIVYSLNIKIINLHHNLIKKGWNYIDLKIDNISYKIINGEINLFFIDDESGLSLINGIVFQDYLEIHGFKSPLGEYSIFGQYNLSWISKINFRNYYPLFMNQEVIIDTLKIKQIVLFNNNEFFNYLVFRKSGANECFAIQFIMGFYRLVFFDDYQRHMSNPEFTISLEKYKIDELFYSIESVYEKLDELYNL